MLESTRDLDFSFEPAASLGPGECRPKDLHGDDSIRSALPSLENHAGSAGPDQAEQFEIAQSATHQ